MSDNANSSGLFPAIPLFSVHIPFPVGETLGGGSEDFTESGQEVLIPFFSQLFGAAGL